MAFQDILAKYLLVVALVVAAVYVFLRMRAPSAPNTLLLRNSTSGAFLGANSALSDDEPVYIDEPIPSGQLIGMVYPPRLGPQQMNFQLGGPQNCDNGPYANIYEDGVVFHCQPNM